MKNLALSFLLLISSSNVLAQSLIEDLVSIDHSWVQGSYWSPSQFPGWGVLVDVQEDTMFGAVYGYMGNEPTFVVFVGTMTSLDPLTFSGQVYFVIEPGVEEEVVGSFTWRTSYTLADPSARLTITSNILNVNNLPLVRFAYVEEDEIDTITGGDWNVVRRILGISFADHYAITDQRFIDDGITYVAVIDLGDEDNIGAAAYFPPIEGDVYGMLLPFTDTSDVFYVFFANNSNMFGRYWILDEGEEPTGDGNYFRGVSDTLQAPNYGGGGGGGGDPTSSESKVTQSATEEAAQLVRQLRQLEIASRGNVTTKQRPDFPKAAALNAYQKLRARIRHKTNMTR